MKSKTPKKLFDLIYKPDLSDESTWLRLDEIRAKIDPGHWSHSRILEEIDVAIETGRFPSQFWEASRSDQAYVLARFRIKSVIQAFEEQLRKK